jgi:hypothetical protein
VYLSDTSGYPHQSRTLSFRESVYGLGTRFGKLYCIISDLYSNASDLWLMKGVLDQSIASSHGLQSTDKTSLVLFVVRSNTAE